VGSVGSVEDGLSFSVDKGADAGVSFDWCDEPDPGVVVFVVVPVEEGLAMGVGVVEGIEALGPIRVCERLVFQG
jgi:hypothetical protein